MATNADPRVAIQQSCRDKPLGPQLVHIRKRRTAFAAERDGSVRSLELFDELSTSDPYDIFGASPVNCVRPGAGCLTTHGAVTLANSTDPTLQFEDAPAAEATSAHYLYL